MDILVDNTADWERESPANPDVVQKLVNEAQIELPDEYLELLHYSNGGEGNLAVEPGWFQIWPAENVIEFNKGYEVQKNLPGFFAFGSSGGGEMLVLDTREGLPFKVVMVPFIPMKVELAKIITENFIEFVTAMGHELENS
jgi:hypothetical protein